MVSMHKKIKLRTAWYGLLILASLLPVLVLSPWLGKKAHALLLDHAMLTEEMFHNEVETRLAMETRRITAVMLNKADPMGHYLAGEHDLMLLNDLLGKITGREPMVKTVAVYNRNARIAASFQQAGHSAAKLDANEPAFVVPMHGRVYIGPPKIHADGHFEFIIAVPILHGEQPAGALIGTIDVNDFWQNINRELPQHDSRIYLMDSRGALLMHSAETKHLQGALLSDKPIVRSLLAGNVWHRQEAYKGFEGSRVFGIGTPVGQLQWGIISEIPSSTIMSPIINSLTMLSVIVFLMFALFAYIAILFTRRLLSPISDLAEAVDMAAKGDYSVQVNGSRFSELDALAGGFNRMTNEIDQRESTLKKLSQAIEQAGESVLITNRKGVIEYVNPAFTKVTGYSMQEAIGSKPEMLRSDRQDRQFYEAMWQTIAGGEVWEGALTNKKKDGMLYPVFMSISPIWDKGEITHFVCIQQDMSEQLLLEEQLRQSQKMEALGTLVGGIAHDFNNMLAGITGNLFLAQRKISGQPDAIEHIRHAESLSYRAGEMIAQLLTFARKGIVQKAPLSLSSFINEALKLSVTLIPENVDFHLSIDDDKLCIQGDHTQIQQILMNLLSNAKDAVAENKKPKIHVFLKRYEATDSFRKAHPLMESDDFACLTVRDNGHGIPVEILENIFEPFYTTKPVGQGSGLGLSMVYGAMQMHGGVIDVDSSVAGGTSFHLYFPLIEEECPAPEAVYDTEGQTGSGELILIVDDEPDIVQTGREVLQNLGYKVLIAASGGEAVALFTSHQHEVELVLSDIIMPDMNGMEMAKQIRTIRHDVPIIFATGHDKELVASGTELENAIILSKPFSIHQLGQTIHKLINKQS